MELVQATAERTWASIERVRVGQALQASEAKYRQLFETSKDGFWWSNKDGLVTEAYTGIAELLGHDQAEMEYNGSLVAFADITERKKAQEDLETSRQEALELVAALKQADENKNKFISLLSHELRNPIATISSGVALLELMVKEPKSLETIAILKRQMQHLSRLTDEILDITRISENRLRLHREKVQLNSLLTDIICDTEP